MRWRNLGLVYGPDGSLPWASYGALQPSPIRGSEQSIRVFVGFRDMEGVARVGYVDVAADEPSRVLRVSQQPSLDIGEPGMFDDNGVAPCAAVQRGDRLFLYYSGYQLGRKVKFLAFGGLAVSEDGGESFARYSRVPVMDRAPGEYLFRAPHAVFEDEGVWKIWYAAGSSFEQVGDTTKPRYATRYIESSDGIAIPLTGGVDCLQPRGDEYRLGRATVLKDEGVYHAFYSFAATTGGFHLGWALSEDGRTWTRRDDELRIDDHPSGWDAQDRCYPGIAIVDDAVYMFYNGNDYGRDGFGCAALVGGLSALREAVR